MNPCLLVSVRTAGVRSRKRVFIAVGAVIPSNEKRRLISLKGNYAVTGIVLVSSTNRGYVTSAGNPIRENPSDGRLVKSETVCHCEERSDEAIPGNQALTKYEIASLCSQ